MLLTLLKRLLAVTRPNTATALGPTVTAEPNPAAALTLAVEDGDLGPATDECIHQSNDPGCRNRALPVLPRPARPKRSNNATNACPAPATGEQAFRAWVQRRRQKRRCWAGIALAALAAGHAVNAKRLRRRYRDGCAGWPAPAGPILPRTCSAAQ